MCFSRIRKLDPTNLTHGHFNSRSTGNYYILNSEDNFKCNRNVLNVMYGKISSLPEILVRCSVNKTKVQPKSRGPDNVV